jgi:hypothetical protein
MSDIKQQNIDGFILQVSHLIEEYHDCDCTCAEIIGALELIKHDLLVEISCIILPDNNNEDN